ncbi:hypothetical protein QWZ13_13345 [Reinekea marina]|nr:hypothetical protein [Reinekea marina]MDN3649899.1 hypothetical protein [Reinekea marina]
MVYNSKYCRFFQKCQYYLLILIGYTSIAMLKWIQFINQPL